MTGGTRGFRTAVEVASVECRWCGVEGVETGGGDAMGLLRFVMWFLRTNLKKSGKARLKGEIVGPLLGRPMRGELVVHGSYST